LRQAIDAATELDILQAKVRLARLTSGVAPVVSTDGRLELRGARHPLLIPAVVDRLDDAGRSARGDVPARSPVPVDILLIPPITVLLVTGPNTGGKTVALKTAGLSALMAQAGLFVPAADARLPVFRSVFADIGDEQSIAANLSTFSWHITNIAGMDRSLALPALVLLDELGAGTDPLEGGALGVAIIEHFRTRGATVVSTTHYEALKTYAATTGGVGRRILRGYGRTDLSFNGCLAATWRSRCQPAGPEQRDHRGAWKVGRARGAARRASREGRHPTSALDTNGGW
jgi:DNA mismatch repair protein MutS2